MTSQYVSCYLIEFQGTHTVIHMLSYMSAWFLYAFCASMTYSAVFLRRYIEEQLWHIVLCQLGWGNRPISLMTCNSIGSVMAAGLSCFTHGNCCLTLFSVQANKLGCSFPWACTVHASGFTCEYCYQLF